LIHGYSDDRYYTENLMNLRDEASSRGFIYLIPNGIKNGVSMRYWKSTDACCDFLDMGWDDSKYLINLIDEVSLKYSIDQDRIFFAGHSNGGFMAHKMGCDHASRIAGIISLAGMNFKDISKC
jgi:polyhydroxybutyrate depolymerase